MIQIRRAMPSRAHDVAPGGLIPAGGIRPLLCQILPLRQSRQRLAMQNFCASPKARDRHDSSGPEIHHDNLAHLIASSANANAASGVLP